LESADEIDHLLARNAQQMQREPSSGFFADARQAGQLSGQALDRINH
jgi:hypothetical protein